MENNQQKIVPFLCFNGNLEEAVDFYSTVFTNAKKNIYRLPDGKTKTATFEIEGMKFYALEGGPVFPFSPAISLFVNCTTQEEVDHLWESLSAGGTPNRCGWLTDKFGVTWQIIPTALSELMNDPDPVKSKNVMNAMMQMDKIDIQKLKDAYDK
jgi:predicted 3-demethylubiquinone-9 3-methyltransferase (glyoxalase superfamily)